jgi:hypothetical protein
MRNVSRILLSLTALLALFPVPSRAQACDPANEVFDGCTLSQIRDFDFQQVFPLDTPATPSADQVVTGAGEEVVDANRATTAPDPFASNLHNSYQDFLNLLSFAVNKVDESADGQALIVRFNPLRQGRHLLGLNLTLAKPSVGEAVSAAIDETDRSAIVDKLNAKTSDLDDQTWSLSYSMATPKCDWGNSRCWGRTPATYREMLSTVLEVIAKGFDDRTANARFNTKVEISKAHTLSGHSATLATPVSDIVEGEGEGERKQVIALMHHLAELEIATTREEQAFFQKSGIEHLASLIDNQPQLAASGSYHNLGRYGGPDEKAATLELQFGRDNINRLIQDCGASTDCIQKKLQAFSATGISTDKFVLTASYKERDKFSLTDLGLDSPVTGFTPVDLGKSSELQAKLQYGRQLAMRVGTRAARFDGSFEGLRTRGDDIRQQNRWVGTATLTIPFGEQMSLPLSLNYANKPEFLVDQKERFGVHFGLSWRLPFGQQAVQ